MSRLHALVLVLFQGAALLSSAAALARISTFEPYPHVQQTSPIPEGLFSEEERYKPVKESDPLGTGFWGTKGSDFVDANGRSVYFSGVIWSGFETPEALVHGLWSRSYKSHLDQIKKLGFNLVRLPFSGQALLNSTRPKGFSAEIDPDLEGLTSLQAMDRIIAGCKERGLKVILDYHRMRATISNEDGLWWDQELPPEVWVNHWIMLAKRYQGLDTIIGADLFNEVHDKCKSCPPGAPFWEFNVGQYDTEFNFRSWSYRVANAIHAVERNWIIFEEGMYNNYWWAANCSALLHAPLNLPIPNKEAYTAHEYGPYVFYQWFHNTSEFPRNLIPMYRRNWGKIHERGAYPVWVGEFGSFYPTTSSKKDFVERTTFRTLIAYIRQIKASWTLAFWGPDSKDTGGILNEDWTSVNKAKMTLLRPIMHPGFGPSPGQT